MYGATVSCPSLNSDGVNIIICATYTTFVSLIRHHSGKAAYRPSHKIALARMHIVAGNELKCFGA